MVIVDAERLKSMDVDTLIWSKLLLRSKNTSQFHGCPIIHEEDRALERLVTGSL